MRQIEFKHKTIKSFLKHYAKWIALAALIGVSCGVASGVFLWALDLVTHFREQNSILLFFLPVGGLVIGWLYHRYGKKVESGNNLIIEEFHDPKTVIPFRMAPLVLFSTLFTHLFGGSVGREGTAVQMGGAIADQFTHFFKMSAEDRRTLLMAGMSGGFGSVFGVPLAGTIFGLEVLTVGKIQFWGLIECAVSAFVAHYTTLLLGIHHTPYVHPLVDALTIHSALAATAAGVLFGLVARVFAFLSHQISKFSKQKITNTAWRAFFGGAIIAALYFLLPILKSSVGLGVPEIVSSMKTALPIYDWVIKTVMTALTIGVGFKGGEVTPLLFIGSTFGNALSAILPLSFPLLAAMGLVGVFAGAANTPFACTFMAMELFGFDIFVYAAIACFVSYFVSGRHGIYQAQRK